MALARNVLVEQIAMPDLLVAEIFHAKRLTSLREKLAPKWKQRIIDEKAAKAHKAAQRKAKVTARSVDEAARLRNVDVRQMTAIAERE